MIVLQDVVFDDLQALVEFIYHGEVNVHQRNLSSFLKTAEVLRVSGLTQPSDSSSANNDVSAPPFVVRIAAVEGLKKHVLSFSCAPAPVRTHI